MKEIRIGNTLSITWNLTVHGAVIEELDLMLQRNEPLRKVKNIPFTIDGNALKFEHDGVAQKECGVYSYTLWANYGKPDQAVIDTCPAYKLIPRDCGDLETDNQIVMNSLIIGVKGPKGDAFTYKDFTSEQIKELQQPALDAIEPINKKVETLEQNRIKQIIWNKSSNANSITEKGLYLLEGVHSNSGDNLPTVAYANGYVGGFMSVTVTTKDEALNEQVIGQNLTLSNKVSGETKQYIRSCIIKNETVSWSAWKEVNTIQMFGIKSSGIATKADIDATIDNGQYAGVYMSDDGFLPKGATFTLTVINNYAATAASSLPAENRQVTQMFVYTPLSTDGSVNKSIVCKRDGIGRSSISWGELESVVNNTPAPFYIGDVNAICSNKYSSHEDILRVMEVTPYELWDAVRQKRFIYSVTSNSSPILIQVLAGTDKNSTYGQFNISFLFPNIDYYISIFTFIVNVKLYYNGKINEWKSLETIKYDYSGLPKS